MAKPRQRRAAPEPAGPSTPTALPEQPSKTDKGFEQHSNTWTSIADPFPPSVQPAIVLIAGLARALAPLLQGMWGAAKRLGKVGMYLAISVSPLLLWAGSKWFQWYVMSYLNKAERLLKWVIWALSFLPKGGAEAGAAAQG